MRSEVLRALVVSELGFAVDTEQVFMEWFASSRRAFWLDSSRAIDPGSPRQSRSLRSDFVGWSDMARYSFLGSADTVLRAGFAELAAEIGSSDVQIPTGFPPELACGYVGYFDYELAAPAWMVANRFVVVDHVLSRTFVCALDDASWVADFSVRQGALDARLRQGAWPREPVDGGTSEIRPRDLDPEAFLVRPKSRYLADIEECLAQLRAGESYEICVTNALELPYDGDPLEAYLRLRRLEPAPNSSYLRIDDLHVVSASPERFLTVDIDGWAESRPIKGTSPRSADPVIDASLVKALAADEKTQAENLMIVDLLRNDLGRVCLPGTISVPAFLHVDTTPTVHQLVSTIRGRLRPSVSAVDAAEACFPPGSMTGAPKIRTMEILAGLEKRPRGVYSGALGWFGHRGNADLAVVIRTAVISHGRVTIGAGGAIVLDSDPEAEYAEMLLKAAVPLSAFTR